MNPDKVNIIREKWRKRIGEGDLLIIPSPYRLLAEPLRQHIEELKAKTPDGFVHVILGHLAMDTFWEQALHQNTAVVFNLALSRLEGVVVTSVPYQIHRTHNGHARVEKNSRSAQQDHRDHA